MSEEQITSMAAIGAAAAAFARLSHEMSMPPFHDLLHPEPVSVDPENKVVQVLLKFRPELARSRENQFYHGGVIAAFIDITAHAAVAVHVGRMAPTIDLRIDYLRPAPAPELRAIGRVLSAGRSIGRADVEVRAHDGRIVAVGRGTFSTLES